MATTVLLVNRGLVGKSEVAATCRSTALTIIAIAALCTFSANAASEPRARASEFQVAVLLKDDAFVLPSEPEDVLAQLTVGAPRRAELLARFRNPTGVRFLTDDRLPSERRRQLPRSDPFRLLERYLVLSYASAADASLAKAALKADADVQYAELSKPAFFSATTPTDYLFPYVAGVTRTLDRQWGPRYLNLETAWDHARGHAYVGVLDSGIFDRNGTTHPDLQANYRRHFSSPFLSGGAPQTLDETESSNNLDVLTYAGHGTHVAGIIAANASTGPGTGTGVAGTCWHCSLMIGRISLGRTLDAADIAAGIQGLVKRGAQVLNLSLGLVPGPDCFATPQNPMCVAMSAAAYWDVAVVAASGNNKDDELDYPARDHRAIAVAGIQEGGALWDQEVVLPDSPRRVGAPDQLGNNHGSTQLLVAPARDIVSTFYTARDWAPPFRCGSSIEFRDPTIDPDPASGIFVGDNPAREYGICTGTSMAAPFVSGIAAIVRSTNPLLTVTDVKNALIQNASRANSWDQYWGYGLPNATASIQAAYASNGRLTPLFALHDPTDDGYIQTTVPQMARAAWWQTLLPKSNPARQYRSYAFLGNTIAGYIRFPGFDLPIYPPRSGQDGERPRARVRLFTTPKDNVGQTLDPVYRLSRLDGNVVRHVMAVGDADKNSAVSFGWTLDGVEGYIYPASIAQPNGTVPIHRWVKSSNIKYVLAPVGDAAVWTARGFSSEGLRGYAFVTDAIFADVPYGHSAQGDIEAMYHHQITTGCGANPPIYCPTQYVTRAQIAAFVGRAEHGPGWALPSHTSIFIDVSNSHALKDWVMQTYYEGIMGACPGSPGYFCPDTALTREEMAQILLRGKYGGSYTPPPPGGQIFADVPTTSPWAPWIHKLYQDGITSGCAASPLRYCPASPVTREDMARFLSRTYGLLQ